MVYVEEAVRAYLMTLTAVTNLVGDRIFTDDVEAGVPLPYIVILVDAEAPVGDEQTFDAENTLWVADVAIEAYARLRSGSRRLAEAIRSNNVNPGEGLQGFAGDTGKGLIEQAILRSRNTGRDPAETGGEQPRYITGSMYEVQFQQTPHSFVSS